MFKRYLANAICVYVGDLKKLQKEHQELKNIRDRQKESLLALLDRYGIPGIWECEECHAFYGDYYEDGAWCGHFGACAACAKSCNNDDCQELVCNLDDHVCSGCENHYCRDHLKPCQNQDCALKVCNLCFDKGCVHIN